MASLEVASIEQRLREMANLRPYLFSQPVLALLYEAADTITCQREALHRIIDWTLQDGSLKSADHRIAKRLAEEALSWTDRLAQPPK